MTKTRPSLLRASLESAREIITANRQLCTGAACTILAYAAAYASLSLTGQSALRVLAHEYGFMLLYCFTLPQQFIIYDAMLNVSPPRRTIWRQYFDIRLERCCVCFVLSNLVALSMIGITGVVSGTLAAWSEGSLLRQALGVLLSTALLGATLALCVRIMFFPIYVAQRRPNPMRKSFRETRGKIMKIARCMFFPYVGLLAVYILGAKLVKVPGNAGWASAAGFAALSTALCYAVTFLETTLFVHVYLRIVRTPPDGELGPPAQDDATSGNRSALGAAALAEEAC